MEIPVAPVLALTSSEVLRYAAAFFFVLVALAMAYALFKVAKTFDGVGKVLVDVDREAVPLMQKAGVTLDNVNANLSNVDDITKDVADITDKIDAMASVVEGAVTKPARKAAAFSAGVSSAFSTFMRRGEKEPACEEEPAPFAWDPMASSEPFRPATPPETAAAEPAPAAAPAEPTAASAPVPAEPVAAGSAEAPPATAAHITKET